MSEKTQAQLKYVAKEAPKCILARRHTAAEQGCVNIRTRADSRRRLMTPVCFDMLWILSVR